MKTTHLILIFLMILSRLKGNAQNLSSYDKGSYVNGKDNISYRMLFPENFDATRKISDCLFSSWKWGAW